MNTTEIKTKNIIRSFNDLYKYARKQFLEYEKIEGIDDWEEYSFSIDCSKDQAKFKDMLQIRFIEELTEATHALDNKEHFYEEITDAINFFLSAYCMLDINFKDLTSPLKFLNEENLIAKIIYPYKTYCLEFYPIIDAVGDLCNLLKNRPWAQSNYLVSMFDFNEKLNVLWDMFWKMLGDIGLSSKDIFDLFERKYLVNKWRIKTGY